MIISRQHAWEHKLKYYFTGVSCKRGHIAKRQLVNGRCWKCKLEDDEVYRASEKGAITATRYKDSNKCKSTRQKYHREHRQQRLRYLRDYREEYREQLSEKETIRNKQPKRQADKIANNRKRKLLKAGRTIYKNELDLIANFYRNCPKGYHVDHIIPLTHSKVSGLHVLANLQYLKQRDNLIKHNKFEPYYELPH